MSTRRELPASIAPLLGDLVAGLSPLRPPVAGAWVSGSVSLGEFHDRTSDIDVIVVTDGPLSAGEVGQVAELHARLGQDHPLARRLEVQYLTLEALGGEPASPYPIADHGQFQPAGRGDLNATTRWLLREHGITLFGPPAADLPIVVSWDDVLGMMRYNLAVYWAGSVRPAALPVLADDMEVVWTVATLCRILTTVEDGTIVDKGAAVRSWSDRAPQRWSRLLGEVRRLQERTPGPGRYATAEQRARDVQAFVIWARGRGLAVLDRRASD